MEEHSTMAELKVRETWRQKKMRKIGERVRERKRAEGNLGKELH